MPRVRAHSGTRKHRDDRPHRNARAVMLAEQGSVCWLCGHDGAFEADHITPIAIDPDQPADPDLMRPAHGANYPCPTCGRRCNSERGARVDFRMYRPALDW